MTPRQAKAADIPALVALARSMHHESNYAPMDFDGEVLTATLHRLINEAQFVVLAEDKGEVVAAMLGIIYPSYFGKDTVANDMGLFVRPESRGGMIAARFVRAFVAWAKACGAKQIRPGVSTGHEGAERLYTGLGFVRAGSIFVMNVEGGGQ
jgi:GNAT superfamily N-acetyltransferase